MHSTLGRALVGRERVLRNAIETAIRHGGARRIVSFPCGPATELIRWLDQARPPDHPVQLLLVDQDEMALETAHRALSRKLEERPELFERIDLCCLHFTVRQLIEPKNEQERRSFTQALGQADLLYSAGMFDALPQELARALVRCLYELVTPGGTLLVANLHTPPDSAWMMDTILGWHLLVRDQEELLDLARGLSPAPAKLNVLKDETEHCLFLSAERPARSL